MYTDEPSNIWQSASISLLESGTAIILFLLTAAVGIKLLDAGGLQVLLGDIGDWEGLYRRPGMFAFPIVVIWAMATGIMALAAAAARRKQSSKAKFLVTSLWLTVLLTSEAIFGVRGEIFPEIVGISEKLVLGSFALALLLYLHYFRSDLFRAPQSLLLLALLAMSAAAAVRAVPQLGDLAGNSLTIWIEDGGRLLGAIFWALHYLTYSVRILGRRRRSRPHRRPAQRQEVEVAHEVAA